MISEIEPYNNYTGDGTTTQFDFDFFIEKKNQLVVYHTDENDVQTTLSYNIDYTINEVGNVNGSYIIFPLSGSSYNTLSSNEKLSLCLTLPIEQQSEYGTSSELNLDNIEYSFDYLTRIAQIQDRKIERAMKLPEGADSTSEDLINKTNVIYKNIDIINAVNNNATNINAVNLNKNNIDTVATNIDKIGQVQPITEEITTIANIADDIQIIADDLSLEDNSKIKKVAEKIDNVSNVGRSIIQVIKVSGNTSNINTCASNITAITNASTHASTASTAATTATQQANVATQKANEAATSASTATTQATQAGNSATEAASSASTASTSATSAQGYASTASTHATTATNKAAEASTSATTATSAMVTCTTAITTVTNAATSANASATTATAQATKAEQQAERAKRYAEETHGASDVTVSNLRALPAINNYEYPQTDEDGLNFLIEEAHSTFDLSKFTVVGSPNITDNGIVSQTDWQNYVSTLAPIDFSKRVVIKEKFEFNSKTFNSAKWIVRIGNIGGLYFTSGYLQTSINDVYSNDVSSSVYNVNEPIYMNWVIDGTSSVCTLTQNNNIIATLTSTITALSSSYAINLLGVESDTSDKNNGSIDLKQFSITVDGVAVFSGNQTGIDTIKPDNYTVVGTPTISANGVASGFSASNYLTTTENINLTTSQSVKMKFHFRTLSDVSTRQMILMSNTYNQFSLELWGGNLRLGCGKNNTWVSDNPLIINSSVQTNTDYYLIFDFTSSGVNYAWSTDNSNWTTGTNATYTFLPDIYDMILRFGVSRNASFPFLGSIDLNAFKIYVDGDLVYQPCLKIPYNLSKTGSKIVDNAYRDRVNDMYEQFGYANYFMLKEEGFYNAFPFNIVGSPTITDGVVSDFSTSNYLTTPIDLSGAWTIKFKFVSDSSSGQAGCLLYNSSGNQIRITPLSIQVFVSADDNDFAAFDFFYDYFTENHKHVERAINYLLEISFDGTNTYIAKLTDLDNETTITDAKTSTMTAMSGIYTIGTAANSSSFNGTIDLNNTILPILKDELKSFTVPQGNLYGMIGQQTLRQSTVSGINRSFLYSDRTLLLTGSCTSGVEVTLPKPFINRHYMLSVPYSAKSATAFTPTQTGDWFAIGEGVL